MSCLAFLPVITIIIFFVSFGVGVAQLAPDTQRQFSENICSEDDLRSRIFGNFFFLISCLLASPRIFEHLKNCIIVHSLITDFYPKKIT